MVKVIVPNMAVSMMSGVAFARIYGRGSPRRVEIVYTDGLTESAYLTQANITEGEETFFSLVSLVQEARIQP